MTAGMNVPLQAPRLSIHLLPETESALCADMNNLLHTLASLVDSMGADVELFGQSRMMSDISLAAGLKLPGHVLNRKDVDRFRARTFIAARDMAVNAYNFVVVKGAIQAKLQRLPTITQLVDWEKFNAAGILLKSSFSMDALKGVRDAVGHADEIGKNPQRHAITGDTGLPFLGGAGAAEIVIESTLMDSSFTYTWKNEIVKIDVTASTASKFRDVAATIFTVIDAAEERLKKANSTASGRP